eukprot:SAG11_NODE_53579_length_103_cov_36.500000_1_plen_29_part_01
MGQYEFGQRLDVVVTFERCLAVHSEWAVL